MKSSAFSPGHVTGFFQICRSDDLLSTGSRGAGMCLSLGARSEVVVEHSSKQSISIHINGEEADAEVTRAAVMHLIGREPLTIEVRTKLELPQSQGFGMSAAGALSTSLALSSMLGLDRQSAFAAAHIAEIVSGCGLGDVSAIHRGGITIREKPGLPPVGEVNQIPGSPGVALAVLGPKLLTRSVLADPVKARAINASGSAMVDKLLKRPSLEYLMDLSRSFAVDTGLASERHLNAIGKCERSGMASMAMLGNSVFALGEITHLKETLSEFGEVFDCEVDTEGPRML